MQRLGGPVPCEESSNHAFPLQLYLVTLQVLASGTDQDLPLADLNAKLSKTMDC